MIKTQVFFEEKSRRYGKIIYLGFIFGNCLYGLTITYPLRYNSKEVKKEMNILRGVFD